MLPRYFTLVLISISSAFLSDARERGKFIPFTKNIISSFKEFDNPFIPARNKDTFPCFCSVFPQIVPLSNQGLNRTYQGIPNASCVPQTITTAQEFKPVLASFKNALDTCGVSNVTYSWSIAIGSNIASINGDNTGSTVNVIINGSGNYTLRLENTVTCSNGSTCSDFRYYNDSAQIDSSHCTCTAGPVTIQPTNKQGNVWTYQGSVQGTCTGQYGVPPNLDTCGVQNTTYQWSIAGGGVASIIGGTNDQTVSVSITGNGPFSLRLDGTTICSDGRSCTNYNFYEDTAKIEPPKHCVCELPTASIEATSKSDSLFTYDATVIGKCTGQYGIPPNLVDCAVQNITYKWFISSGGNAAEIIGNDQGPTVTVRIKASGPFTLQVFGNVICNEGNNCSYQAYIDDSTNNEKVCNIDIEEKVEPKMDGGLQPKYNGTKKIDRDGFIALGADGKDYDQVKFTCIPSANCNETGSNKTVILNSRVRFEWKVTGGEGNFVSLGGLPENSKSNAGDHVIFQPPYVALAQKANDTSVTTTVQLLIIDDNPTQPTDPTVTKNIVITTKRFKTSPDEYTVTVQSPAFTVPGVPTVPNQPGDCNAVGPTWELKTDLKKPEIELPPVPDRNKMVVGEWIVLNAKDQRDGDKLKMVCQSSKCDNSGYEKVYEDNLDWEWTIVGGGNNGRFVSDPKGRYIIYEAPEKLPGKNDMIEVKIRVKVKNTDGLKAVDVIPPDGEITLKIFSAGVKLQFPPLTWVPEENNEVPIKSFLVFKEDGRWKPALAHQFRIHFFELLNVSTEEGVSLNDPAKNVADDCRDLYIGTGKGDETFNDSKGKNCKTKDLFLEARTKKPEREYTINIKSGDFGSYGFLKTEASKNKKPEYESVPVVLADVPHPTRRVINRQPYKDNRITIPRDVDENRIADGGWRSLGNVLVPDPANNEADNDNNPIGDKFRGDGLTSYEEYRGFNTTTNGVAHIRTNPNRKDLFVHNPDELPVTLFRQQSGLVVHEINEQQYGNDNTRVVNFNFNKQTHIVDQQGLLLKNAGNHATLLGIALGANSQPAPPNWVEKVNIYADRISTFCTAKGVNFANKLLQITAHELGHACNVYHHGEGNPAVENSFNLIHGLRSGNISCIMRYDNVQTVVPPEAIGSIFCTGAAGTGANANNMGFGDANTDLCRGNCKAQFRVSGKENNYPKRVTNADCKKK